MLRRPGTAFVIAIVMLGVLITTLRWLRARRTNELQSLCFEAEPDDKLTILSVRSL